MIEVVARQPEVFGYEMAWCGARGEGDGGSTSRTKGPTQGTQMNQRGEMIDRIRGKKGRRERKLLEDLQKHNRNAPFSRMTDVVRVSCQRGGDKRISMSGNGKKEVSLAGLAS